MSQRRSGDSRVAWATSDRTVARERTAIDTGGVAHELLAKGWIEGVDADIKPANVLIARDGRVKVVDFDGAYYLSAHSDLVAAFGAGNHVAAMEHWLHHGKGEGRRTVP